jgi:hypothetical protein
LNVCAEKYPQQLNEGGMQVQSPPTWRLRTRKGVRFFLCVRRARWQREALFVILNKRQTSVATKSRQLFVRCRCQ